MESFFIYLEDLANSWQKKMLGNYQKHLKRNTFNYWWIQVKIINFLVSLFLNPNVDLSLEHYTHYQIKDEKLKKCLHFWQKYYMELNQKQEFIQEMKALHQQSL
nr:hypothetical protein [Mycoplasmopsis bovis]